MEFNSTASLDMPSAALSLVHPISPRSMQFLHRGQTEAQVIDILFKVIYVPETTGHRVWLLISQFECLLAIGISFILLIRKKAFGNLWLLNRRDSPFGSFYVTNAVFCLVLGVAGYLFAWVVTAIVIATFSFVKIPSYAWWWTIPLPFAPLILGAELGLHGFILGCSPRSPLSPFSAAHRNKWNYLPVIKNALIANAALFVTPVVFVVTTCVLSGFAGHAYFHAKHLAREILPADIVSAIVAASHHRLDDPAFRATQASDQLIWASRRVAAAYFESHRYVCINLIVSTIAAFGIWVPCCIYGLPNSSSLVNYACSRCPTRPPSSYGYFRKSWWLVTKGRPTEETNNSTNDLTLNIWKMTLFAQGYIWLIAVAAPGFGMVPIYIVANSFPKQVKRGNISSTLRDSIIIVSCIIFMTCVFYIFFCRIISIEPLFRSAIGVNLIRSQVPIEIKRVERETYRDGGRKNGNAPPCMIVVEDVDLEAEDEGDGTKRKSYRSSLGSSALRVEIDKTRRCVRAKTVLQR
ncbi:fructose 1,6-bisphosphate aldolase [Pseudozyma hubeiensis SY62]|uniref:Fructose 1,6-bisphosphate aldolase n=1 Tax=Pseudozyma hubeiensis (strain SY62) TaxID=1305764 RepID=R9P9X4_PSEHS|nr:fructose 1,6-bisphosphate aldolase [Pseudozyma hubeiensis SY62]GAC98188.1 fructose 1,6-bisphosphate aldolase [Pseudozyma hubeiensis SY62]